MHLKDIVTEAHAAAITKGWYDGERNIPELLALIHSEISEALEEYRRGDMATYYREGNAKPEGFAIEIADAVIRIADLCGYIKIDLESAIETKMAYNRTRPHRHGGKRA